MYLSTFHQFRPPNLTIHNIFQQSVFSYLLSSLPMFNASRFSSISRLVSFPLPFWICILTAIILTHLAFRSFSHLQIPSSSTFPLYLQFYRHFWAISNSISETPIHMCYNEAVKFVFPVETLDLFQFSS